MSERAITMLRNALKMEQKGEKHYAELASLCGNDMARRVLVSLAQDESAQAEQIRLIWKHVSGGRPWPDPMMLLETTAKIVRDFYSDLKRDHENRITDSAGDVEALAVGIDHVQRSLAFYRGQLAAAEEPLEERFLQSMVKTEQRHLKALEDLKTLFEDPEAW